MEEDCKEDDEVVSVPGFPVSSACSRGGTVQVGEVGGGQEASPGATVRSQAVK